jgi:hypothetical protein
MVREKLLRQWQFWLSGGLDTGFLGFVKIIENVLISTE